MFVHPLHFQLSRARTYPENHADTSDEEEISHTKTLIMFVWAPIFLAVMVFGFVLVCMLCNFFRSQQREEQLSKTEADEAPT